MRIGKAPTRKVHMEYKPEEITCAILVHIPNLLGYYEQRLDIFKACLLSMTQNAGIPHQMLVFDNASCKEVSDEISKLQREGIIDIVVRLNENVGKYWAMRWLFWIAPGKVIAYTDDDMLFFPGWLEESMSILSHFPNVGCVSVYPFRPQGQVQHLTCKSTIEWAEKNATLTRDRVIPEWWDKMTIQSVGRSWDEYIAKSSEDQEYIVEYEGKKAIIQGHHCQFIGYKANLLKIPQVATDQLMGNCLSFDHMMDQGGFLRLNTYGGYAMHIGNIIDPDLWSVMRKIGIKDNNIGHVRTPPVGSWFVLKIKPLKKILESMYEWLYWSLSRTT